MMKKTMTFLEKLEKAEGKKESVVTLEIVQMAEVEVTEEESEWKTAEGAQFEDEGSGDVGGCFTESSSVESGQGPDSDEIGSIV